MTKMSSKKRKLLCGVMLIVKDVAKMLVWCLIATILCSLLCGVMLIVKGVAKMLVWRLIATILCSVCIENGWIISNDTADVSYVMFWELYASIFVLVPIILFYRGLTGKYHVEIKEYKDNTSLGKAKLGDSEDT